MLGDNRGVVDGVLSKDPKENWTKDERLQCFFHVSQKYERSARNGKWVKRRHPCFLAFVAYDEIARTILDSYQKGDFVRVEFQLDSFHDRRVGTRLIARTYAINRYSKPQTKDPKPEEWMTAVGSGLADEWSGKPSDNFAF